MAAAKQDAQSIASELDAADAKKGKNIHRTISEEIGISIPDTIRYPKTNRAGKNDPGFYIYNFSDNNGFVIISGDKRAFGRLGWAGNGKIDGQSSISMFLSRSVRYIQSMRQQVEAMRGDKDYISLITKLSNFKKTSVGTSDKSSSNSRMDCLPPNARTSQAAPPNCPVSTTSTLI